MLGSLPPTAPHEFLAPNERSDAVIDRREDLAFDTFSREYLRLLKPVVIAKALYGLPAMGKWTPDFFRDEYGSKPVEAGLLHRRQSLGLARVELGAGEMQCHCAPLGTGDQTPSVMAASCRP